MLDVMLFYLLLMVPKDFIEIFCLYQLDFIHLFIYSGEPRAYTQFKIAVDTASQLQVQLLQ